MMNQEKIQELVSRSQQDDKRPSPYWFQNSSHWYSD